MDVPLPEAVRAEQWARAQAQLARVRQHSRFYKEHLRHVPPILQDWEQWNSIPFTQAEHLVHWQSLLCVSQGHVQRMVTLQSSGTSGLPTRLAFSEGDLAATMALFLLGVGSRLLRGKWSVVLLPGAPRLPRGGALRVCAL